VPPLRAAISAPPTMRAHAAAKRQLGFAPASTGTVAEMGIPMIAAALIRALTAWA